MTPEQWQQTKIVLDHVLNLAPAERPAYLEAFYLREPTLRGEVESLVRSYESAGSFLETSCFRVATAAEHVPDSWIGRRLGAYQLVERIGAGGMGIVYRAVRADGQYEKQVAVKLIQGAFGTEYFLNRFRSERQILATLDHPNIARLIDGGSTEDGLPYVVMEYVDGVPIDEYCDTHRLGIAARLELFCTVCSAVHYAHEHRVMHRDLKPGNILVTGEGVPKLLDFGIAKIVDAGDPAAQPERSVALLRILTPEFASPEQVRGLPSGRASDAYSLGVILYVLLTGQRPYRASHSAEELIKAICETQPERPSMAAMRSAAKDPVGDNSEEATVGQPRSNHQGRILTGDLDDIVLKALRKEPESRYTSAEDLAADIRRHLSGLPVRARRGTFVYRFRKFMGRHVTSVWAATLATLACVFLGGMLWRFGTGFPPREAPFNPPAHSVAVLPFANLSGDPGQEYFSDGVSEDLLDALSRIDELQVPAPGSSFKFKGKNVDMGIIARKLNVSTVLEGSVRRFGDMVRVTVHLSNAVNGFQLWSQTYDRRLEDILRVQSDIAMSVAQQLRMKLSDDETAKIELGGTRVPEAYDAYLRGLRRFETEEDPKSSALEAAEQAIEFDPKYAAAYALKARALRSISMNNADTREALAQQSAKAAERAVELASDLGEAHLSLGLAREGLRDYAGALSEFTRAVSLTPGSSRAQSSFARFLVDLGHNEVALAAARRAVGLNPQDYRAHNYVATVFVLARQYKDALAAGRAALEINPKGQAARDTLGIAYLALGEPDRARQVCEEIRPSPNEDIGVLHRCLALAYHALGRQKEAEMELTRFKALTGNSWAILYAGVYARWGDQVNALRWLATAEQTNDPSLVDLRVLWTLDPLRTAPEFQALVRRLNFPP